LRYLKWFLGVVLAAYLVPKGLYWAYDHLYFRDRIMVRNLCERFKAGTPLDLVALQATLNETRSRLLFPSFKPEWLERQKGLPPIGDLKRDVTKLDPQGLESLFFLAEGFNRESVTIVVSEGQIQALNCKINPRFDWLRKLP